jgi:aconitate hydratase
MGIIPFVFEEGTSWASLNLKGDELVEIDGVETIKPRQKMVAKITYADGSVKEVPILCRIDTLDELDYYKNGGILQYVLRDLAA